MKWRGGGLPLAAAMLGSQWSLVPPLGASLRLNQGT
jgi:hypothetical protein